MSAFGHYIPCLLMVFCYFKVFFVMKQKKNCAFYRHCNGETSSAQTIAIPTNTENEGNNTGTTSSSGTTQESSSEVNSNSVSTISSNVSKSTFHSNENIYGSQMPTSTQSGFTENGLHGESRTTKCQSKQMYLIRTYNREKKIFVTLTYVLSSFLICWFPFFIVFDIYAWSPELVPGKLYTVFGWMIYVNSMLNPFIYAYTCKEFRVAFLKVCRCLCRLRN